MKLAFHRGTIFNALEDIIRFRTDSPYCHVELVFSDGKAFSAESDGTGYVGAPSATDTDWTIVETQASEVEEALVRGWCEAHTRLPYDWAGVVGLNFDIVKQAGASSLHAFFCSALVVAALQVIGWFKFAAPATINPGEVYLMTMARLEV